MLCYSVHKGTFCSQESIHPLFNPKYILISVCSTTMWIGHLSRFTTEEELRQEVEHYGEIISINVRWL